MSTCRVLPGVKDRVETGIIQFGDDWPGIFIRGDNCFGYWLNLEILVNKIKKEMKLDNVHEMYLAQLEDLLNLLKQSDTRNITEYIDDKGGIEIK